MAKHSETRPTAKDQILEYHLSFSEAGGWGNALEEFSGEERQWNSPGHKKARFVAQAAGKPFYRFKSRWLTFETATSRTCDVNARELPETNRAVELLYRVVEYVADPKRSHRAAVVRDLNEYGFFNVQTYEQRADILHRIAKTYCGEGQERFYNFMGELLPKPDDRPLKFTVTLACREGARLNGTIESVNSALERYGVTCRVEIPKD